MFRGTTPTNTFTTTIDLSEMSVIYISYKQRGEVKIEKTKEDITFTEETVDEATTYVMSVQLSQEDTLALVDTPVEIQVRAKNSGGTAIASEIIKVPVERILKDGEI